MSRLACAGVHLGMSVAVRLVLILARHACRLSASAYAFLRQVVAHPAFALLARLEFASVRFEEDPPPSLSADVIVGAFQHLRSLVTLDIFSCSRTFVESLFPHMHHLSALRLLQLEWHHWTSPSLLVELLQRCSTRLVVYSVGTTPSLRLKGDRRPQYDRLAEQFPRRVTVVHF